MAQFSGPRRWCYLTDLSVQIGALRLKNPILTASGTFGYGQECAGLVNLNQLGGIVTKAITLEPRDGNPPPRIVETAAGMLNSIGLANVGVDRFIKEKWPFLQSLDTAIIVNVAGSYVEEYVEVVKKLEAAEGIHGYELNVSCPNVRQGGLAIGSDRQSTFELTTKVRAITDRVVIVKLTPNVTRIADIALAAQEAGADAVSLINTLRGMAIDIKTRRPKLANVFGGLSGPAIKPVALAKVYEVYQAVTIPIIGIGGIMNYQDVLEFLLAGATAVEIGTANFINPAIGVKIIHELEKYCQTENITNLNQLIGGLVTESTDY
ncbi:MAG: dihydroorotate dehydrogenase [candidate division KSB1 bacterium]|nr:dihydroorotate dehydrogenase [candidate division KSB1 bacterium]